MSSYYFYILYIAIGISTMRIFLRLGLVMPVLAFVPVARELMLIKIARKRWWWIFLMIIPVVNLWTAWVVWGAVARGLSRSVWWGRGMIVPFLNIFILLVLGFDWQPKN